MERMAGMGMVGLAHRAVSTAAATAKAHRGEGGYGNAGHDQGQGAKDLDNARTQDALGQANNSSPPGFTQALSQSDARTQQAVDNANGKFGHYGTVTTAAMVYGDPDVQNDHDTYTNDEKKAAIRNPYLDLSSWQRSAYLGDLGAGYDERAEATNRVAALIDSRATYDSASKAYGIGKFALMLANPVLGTVLSAAELGYDALSGDLANNPSSAIDRGIGLIPGNPFAKTAARVIARAATGDSSGAAGLAGGALGGVFGGSAFGQPGALAGSWAGSNIARGLASSESSGEGNGGQGGQQEGRGGNGSTGPGIIQTAMATKPVTSVTATQPIRIKSVNYNVGSARNFMVG